MSLRKYHERESLKDFKLLDGIVTSHYLVAVGQGDGGEVTVEKTPVRDLLT